MTRNMYNYLSNEVKKNSEYHYKWPYDQYYASNYVFRHKDDFVILQPDIINTPFGQIIKHFWTKSGNMMIDLNNRLSSGPITNSKKIIISDCLDSAPYPNVTDIGPSFCK